MDDDLEVLNGAAGWLADGAVVALATVMRTWGSAPRAVGAHMAVHADGSFIGSVSGGCVESAVIAKAQELLAKDGPLERLSFGISDETAWSVGLACGGTIEIVVCRADQTAIAGVVEAVKAGRSVALVSDLASGHQAAIAVDGGPGEARFDEADMETLRQLANSDASGFLSDEIFARCYGPPWSLLIIGAVHIAEALAWLGSRGGFAVTLIDPRRAFLRDDLFGAARLLCEWPEPDVLKPLINSRTAVVALTHDPKIDDPALSVALPGKAFYVGALGSTKTAQRRRARLLEAGVPEAAMNRLSAPIGLDIGARTPFEIAVSVYAEIVAVRRGKR